MFLKKLYYDFIMPEKSGREIGLFRACCAIFGGLIISYLGMTFLALLLPSIPNESIIVSLWFTTFVWACVSLWISLSFTKLEAFLRVIIPTSIFSISILLCTIN